MYTEQKKKESYKFGDVTFLSGYMGYEILLTAIFYIGLCK